jgi:hypothetical protein
MITTLQKSSISFFFLMLHTALTSSAQLANCDQKEALAVKNAKMYFILKTENNEADKIYNHFLTKYVPTYWNLGKFDFVSADTIDKIILNDKVYFVTIFDEEIISTNGIINVSSMGIIKGGKLFKQYKHTDELAWVYVRKDLWDYAPRFPGMIQVLQNTIVWKADAANKKKDIYSSFNKQLSMKDRVLYIERKDLNEKLVDVNKLSKHYKFNYKIVEKEELLKAIEEQDPKVVYMHLTNNRNSSCFFISAKEGKVVWEHQATINTDIQLVNFLVLEEFSSAIYYAIEEAK